MCAWAPAGGALGATSGARMHVAHASARPGGASAPARARGGRHARGRLQLQLQGELQLSCASRALLPAPRAAALGAPAVCAAESASYGHRAGSGGRAGRQCGALAQRWGRSGSRAHFPCPWRLRRGPSGGARAPLSAQSPSATASSGGSGGGSLCDKAERLAAAAGGAYAPSEADAAAGGGEGARTAPLWRPMWGSERIRPRQAVRCAPLLLLAWFALVWAARHCWEGAAVKEASLPSWTNAQSLVRRLEARVHPAGLPRGVGAGGGGWRGRGGGSGGAAEAAGRRGRAGLR